MKKSCWLLFGCLFTCFCCDNDAKTTSSVSPPELTVGPAGASAPLFALLPAVETGIDFNNQLTEGPNTNILVYEYFYNGGGVAAGDLNGDGYADLYFTANMAENKLYLGDGALHFTEVTSTSGAGGRPGPWKTGVTFVDINGDRKLDIYLCYSGMLPPDKRRNQLFVNQGNDADGVPHFREEAASYGLNSPAFSNQAYFFDYDADGDLDCLLLNHNPKSLPILNVAKTRQLLAVPDHERGLRLYRNDDQKFVDVTEAAGINGSALSYGLGLAISDLDRDGDPDFYVSNDYEVPDYLYYNNGDGTFTDRLGGLMDHTSHFSMGSDIADVDNNGKPDIYTLDMLPEDNYRRKLLSSDDNRSKLELNLASGFHHQTMRNMLHLNRGKAGYAEIGQMAGVATTDWSWSALFADFDNDSRQDLHVTNGYVRDYTNQDFIKYMEDFVAKKGRLQRADLREIIAEMPASEVSNYVFANTGELNFQDRSREWGLARPSNSNGAIYADLDADGDLDLVVNNVNQEAFVYRNEGTKNTYLEVELIGLPGNTQGVGAQVEIFLGKERQLREAFPNRGYLSSVSPILHFGTWARTQVQRLYVTWPDGKVQELKDVDTNQRLTLRWSDAGEGSAPPVDEGPAYFVREQSPLEHFDKLSGKRDFDDQPLLPRQLTDVGPVLKIETDANGKQNALVLTGTPAEKAAHRRTAFSSTETYKFTGGGPVPGRYPEAEKSRLWERNSKGIYTTLPPAQTSSLSEIGLVTDATWSDLDQDGQEELLTVGEYQPLRIFGWEGEQLVDRTDNFVSRPHAGWWNTLLAEDLNGDGRPDLVLGNEGENNLFPQLEKGKLELYYGDLDDNGFIDPILQLVEGEERYLDATRDELLKQLTHLRPVFTNYEKYAREGNIDALEDRLAKAHKLEASDFRTSLYLSRPNGTLGWEELPLEVQYAPVHTITPLDIDEDGDTDLLLCGNEGMAKQRWGKSVANAGCLLRNEAKGHFSYVPQERSGLQIRGDVRDVVRMDDLFLFGIRGGAVVAYRLNPPAESR